MRVLILKMWSLALSGWHGIWMLATWCHNLRLILPSFGGVLVYIFREQILALLIGADSTAAHSPFVTGIELLAALYSLMNGAIPIPQLVNGRTVYDDPSDMAAGGLIRHTLAGSIGILKQCISHLFREGGVLFEMSRDARPDLGLFYPVWSLHIGWPADVEATISVVVSGCKTCLWFGSSHLSHGSNFGLWIGSYCDMAAILGYHVPNRRFPPR